MLGKNKGMLIESIEWNDLEKIIEDNERLIAEIFWN